MRQITSFIVSLLACFALWIILTTELTDFTVYEITARPQAKWQVLALHVWSDAPLLLVSVATGMLIFRTQPLLFGIVCALATTASVVLCTSTPVLMNPVFVVKWTLFLVFSTGGSYIGWWILQLRDRRNTVLKAWQSFTVLAVMCGVMALWQSWYRDRFMSRLLEPMYELMEQSGEHRNSELSPAAVASDEA